MKSFLSILVIIAAVSVHAEARRDQVRQAHQRGRIAEGVHSGELTRGEAHKLKKNQKRIDKAQAAAKADGVVTEGEKEKLEKMQDRQSKAIYNQKHDDDKRPKAKDDSGASSSSEVNQ